MKKYLLLLHEKSETIQELDSEQIKELIDAHTRWANLLIESGPFIAGDGVDAKGTLIIGEYCLVKQTTLADKKISVGGYYILQAEDIDSAISLAKGCPCHLWGGTTEVRKIMEYED